MEPTAASAEIAWTTGRAPEVRSPANASSPSPGAEIWPITWSRGFQVVTSASAAEVRRPEAFAVDLIEFYFQIEGEGRLEPADGTSLPSPSATAAILLQSTNPAVKRPSLSADGLFVRLICTAPFIRQLLRDEGHDPQRLHDELTGPGFRQLGLKPAAAIMAQELLGCDSRNGLNRLRAEAKSIELLCTTLEALYSVHEPSERPLTLSTRDIALLGEARELIRSRMSDALTIPQLARAVGLNQQKLKLGFKHLFGQTVFEYSIGVRMSEALRLMRAEPVRISTVASRVGYRCPASFTRAFERHYGYLPRAVRKGAVAHDA